VKEDQSNFQLAKQRNPVRKILIMPDGNWLSHVSRPLEIAKALRELGNYHIVFGGDGEYMRLPKECGFDVRPALTHDPEHVMRCSRSGRANWWDYATLSVHVEADLEIFKQEKPDLVLGDFRLSLSTSPHSNVKCTTCFAKDFKRGHPLVGSVKSTHPSAVGDSFFFSDLLFPLPFET
jgi:UDP:flavonoid glycosyltransferase YjiC (YdhE family)